MLDAVMLVLLVLVGVILVVALLCLAAMMMSRRAEDRALMRHLQTRGQKLSHDQERNLKRSLRRAFQQNGGPLR